VVQTDIGCRRFKILAGKFSLATVITAALNFAPLLRAVIFIGEATFRASLATPLLRRQLALD
jgi:hypothetical protein